MEHEYRNFTSLLDDYLKDPQFAADLLSEALAEDDFDVFLLSLKDVMRVHGNLSSIAKKASLSRGTLYKLFSENANPEMKTLLTLLDSLGYKFQIVTKKQSKVRSRRPKKAQIRPRKRTRKFTYR